MNSIAKVLENIFKDPQLRPYLHEGIVLGAWPRAVGPQIAKVTKPVKFYNGTLYVRVESAVWRTELSASSQELIDSLNKQINKKLVKKIHFK